MKYGILFGGRSYEHDISVITAVEVAAILGEEAIPIYAKDGSFYRVCGRFDVRSFARKEVRLRPVRLLSRGGRGYIAYALRKIPLDCMILCCHGGEGEDGRFSALMEVYGFPYTASSPLASAVTMDKGMSKILFDRYGFPSAEGILARRGEDVLERIKSLEYPLIVKPSHLGSSIGVGIAHDETELIEALAVAYEFDESVLIERYIEDALEVNCAAFREGDAVVLSDVECPISGHEYLTFEDKYVGGKYKGEHFARPEAALAERARKMTEEIYRAFDLFGIARVDFLYSKKEDVLYVNEINSQPGSLAYYLFERVGIDFYELLARIAKEGIKRAIGKDIIAFNSGVLDNLCVLPPK